MRRWLLLSLLGALVAVLFAASLLIGPAHLPVGTSLRALFGAASESRAMVLVMQEIRLPRALLGLLVGAALGLSGAALQGFLRNPLAEPGLIGISGASALGAVIALQTGLAAAFALALPPCQGSAPAEVARSGCPSPRPRPRPASAHRGHARG